MIESTLAIIKPDIVRARKCGKIIDIIENNGFDILQMQKLLLTKQKAEAFYAVHKERPFFGELVSFMCSGPVIVMVLEKDNAIAAWRLLMGHTNPAQATPGTIRKEFGTSIGDNAVHGSDSADTAATELKFFFPTL